MAIRLSGEDEAYLSGERGAGGALAMRVLVRTAEAMGAERLLDISSVHVDGCLYHGQAGLDFVRTLVDGEATVKVPTTLNVGALDLLHPELVRLPSAERAASRELMEAYVELGCRPTWTCAPYQTASRPPMDSQIAWAESNAIVFANSVLGARTERYGDFLDICAAITGRAPAVGLHLAENRHPSIVVSVQAVSTLCEREDVTYPLIGHVLGRIVDTEVALIRGLPAATTEDQLKALGAAAASSGSVALFHAEGITPEARAGRFDGVASLPVVEVTQTMLEDAQRELTTLGSGQPDAVAMGTPHYSLRELEVLRAMVGERRCRLPIYVNVARATLAEFGDRATAELEQAGVRVVTDTCSYITPILDPEATVVMTDSAKWAYYAPANLGVEVIFGSARACVESAVEGRLVSTW